MSTSHAVSSCVGDGVASESDCLDDWGWDPMVDAFLRECVHEAPRGDLGVVDFAWVSSHFLETLEPAEDQIMAALEKFNPSALEERWLYLQQVPEQQAIIQGVLQQELEIDGAALDEEQEDEPNNVGPEEMLSQTAICNEGSMQPSTAPSRVRILDAMQSFLFGRQLRHSPVQHVPPQEARGTSKMAEGSASREAVGGSSGLAGVGLGVPVDASDDTGCTAASSGRGISSPGEIADKTCKVQGVGVPEICGADFSGARALHRMEREVELDALSSCSGGSNEALRCCLDELRWHGEALRRCADGEDAGKLNAEGAERRKALLWSLGVCLRQPA